MIDTEHCEYWKKIEPYWGKCSFFDADCSAKYAFNYLKCALYKEFLRREYGFTEIIT